jgi:hypothetical protein
MSPAPEAKSAWLYSRPVDLAVILVPLLVCAATFATERLRGLGAAGNERGVATFITQMVLGNSTHVILTFLALGVRRDLLSPTPGQKGILLGGSAATFAGSFVLLYLTSLVYSRWVELGFTITYIFAQHHRLSQTKGVWALYSLRAKQAPDALERKVQSISVPLGLVLLVARILLVPREQVGSFAVLTPIPGEPAPLPFAAVYVLMAPAAVLSVVGIHALFRAKASTPKKIYVIANFAIVLLMIYQPIYGALITGGVHGLEYFLITSRLLRSREGDRFRVGRAGSWALILAAIAPLVLLATLAGAFSAPEITQLKSVRIGYVILNSITMAHYFGDAFMFRLRIPEVRRVVLRRLGFA